jgi:hypothetical protein
MDSPHSEIPLIVFIGDGVSDLPADREADVLFARKSLRLEEYCIENKIPYIGFGTFADIQVEVEKIMKEDEEKTGGVGRPTRFNPRANLWRRVSSQQAVRPSQLRSYSSMSADCPSTLQLLIYVASTRSREEKMFLWPHDFSEYKPKTITKSVAA